MMERIVPVFKGENNLNLINFSCVYRFEGPRHISKTIALKYVFSGMEGYHLNNRDYTVCKHQYLLMDKGTAYQGMVNTKSPNEGLCVYIDTAITSNILFHLSQQETKALDYPQDYLSYSLDITEGLYHGSLHFLGEKLKSLAMKVKGNFYQSNTMNEDVIYNIAEALVVAQSDISHRVRRIKVKKPSIQKEIFRRVEESRSYIHDNLYRSMNIEELAAIANMSPYHYMRSFKQAFKVSTYQYIMEQRLQLAIRLMEQHRLKLTDIATLTGFNDLFTFSKAFKRRFGKSPSYWID